MMVDGDAPRPPAPREPPPAPNQPSPEENRVPPERPSTAPEPHRPVYLEDYFFACAISAVNRMMTWQARCLHIYDVAYKLKHMDTYDIGGTYYEKPELVPELWFFFTTTVCPGQSYLLNLFVCHRLVGNFSIGVSSSNRLIHRKGNGEKPGQFVFPENLSWHTFKSSQPNENFYIKTYCFSENDVKLLDNNNLVVPIMIEIDSLRLLNDDIVKRIKLSHDFGNVLAKQEKSDFVLLSKSGKEYPVHKIFIAAHSQVLRDIMKSKTSTKDNKHTFLDLADNEMELLLQFIYTGTIKDILHQDCLKLLEIADRFQLRNLFFLTQFAISDQININNAIDIACLSEKYKLEKLQATVFKFIKTNTKVLETDGWKNLDDVNLAKKLFQFMQTESD